MREEAEKRRVEQLFKRRQSLSAEAHGRTDCSWPSDDQLWLPLKMLSTEDGV